MKRILLYSGILVLLGMLPACETDFDVTADPQDVTVIYGLLDQQDTFTYIKVNRAFLGDGDALQMAAVPDSSYYPFSDIEVFMEEYMNGNYTGKRFDFDTLTIENKEPGVFYYPQQVVYVCQTLKQLKTDHTYKLIVRNLRTGKEVTAETPLVGGFTIERPLYNPNNPVTGFNGTVPYTAEWYSASNGKRYEMTVRFNYTEVVPGTTDTLFKHVDWQFSPKKSNGLQGGEKMELKYEGSGFISLIGSSIPVNPDVNRTIGMIDFIFSVGADDLNTYIEVNEPGSSIIQERPEYTNLSDGIGIFSSRSHKVQSYYLNTQTVEILLDMNLSFY